MGVKPGTATEAGGTAGSGILPVTVKRGRLGSGNQGGVSPKVRSLQKCRATKNERGDANDSQLAADGTDQWGRLTGVGVTNRQCLCVVFSCGVG